ncbi:MAG: sulfite exporter TauE/SafE family protein [Betaproteobacteria bacterium]
MQTYVEIFLIGLLGSMHCIGMCGGFVAMYSFKKPAAQPSLPYHLLYNLGRVTTYSILGGIVGYIGSFAASIGEQRGIPGAVLLLAGALMIIMGLNMAGVLGRRGFFEDTGIAESSFFRRAFHRVLALVSVWGTFFLGLLLGFLPCGFLYPIFMNAAASGGFFSGMSMLAVFGLSTVPALLSLGSLITRIKPHRKVLMYRIAAALIILLGLRTVLRGMSFNGWILPGRFW